MRRLLLIIVALSLSAVGQTWSKINLPSGTSSPLSLESCPRDGAWFETDGVGGFYKSSNQGNAWTPIMTGITVPSGWSPQRLDVDPTTCNLTAVVRGPNSGGQAQFYYSRNEGTNWTLLTLMSNCGSCQLSMPAPGVYRSDGTFLNVIRPANNCGLMRGSWATLPSESSVSCNPTPPGDSFGLWQNTVDGSIIAGFEVSGVYRSADGGKTFSLVGNPNNSGGCTEFGDLWWITNDNAGNILVATANYGVWKSSTPGNGVGCNTSTYNWTHVFNTGGVYQAKSLARDASGNIYLGHGYNSNRQHILEQSTDGGTTWDPLETGISGVGTTYTNVPYLYYSSKDNAMLAMMSGTSSALYELSLGTPPPSQPDFSLTPESASLTIQAAGQGTDVINIAAQNGSFGNQIQLSCAVSGPSPTPSCALSPTSVTPGSNPATSTLTVTAPTSAMAAWVDHDPPGSSYAVWMLLAAAGMIPATVIRKRRPRWMRCGLLMLMLLLVGSCGGGGNTAQQGNNTAQQGPQNYTVTVSAASGIIQHTAQVIVTVQ